MMMGRDWYRILERNAHMSEGFHMLHSMDPATQIQLGKRPDEDVRVQRTWKTTSTFRLRFTR